MPRIMIISMIGQNDPVVEHLKAIASNQNVEVIYWDQIQGAISSFIRQQRNRKTDTCYLVTDDLDAPGRRSLLSGLVLLLKAKCKIVIDKNGKEFRVSWANYLFDGCPRMIAQILWSLLVLTLNWTVLKILSIRLMNRLAYVDIPQRQKAIAGRGQCLGFFWTESPGVGVDTKVGGEFSHIVGFTCGLRKLGWKTFMISSRPIVHDLFDTPLEVCDAKGLPAWPGEVKEMAFNWKVFWKARAAIRKWRPTLIYHRTSIFSYIGVLLSIFYRIPLVLEVNSSQAWESDHFWKLRFLGVLKNTEAICYQYAAKISVVSHEVGDYLIKHGVSKEKIILNPNGVDTDFFVSDGRGKQITRQYKLLDKIIIGFIGSFNLYHGILTLARAVRPVSEAVANVHFLIIGDGRLWNEFKEIIELNNMRSFVTMTGRIPHEQVPKYLDACDILASPHWDMVDGSPFFGSPTKLFEYMSMRKAIVASRVGQLEQILKHRETALLVPPDNPQALAEAIIELSKDPELRIKLGSRARECVVNAYTWKMNAQRVLEPLQLKIDTT